MPAVALSIAGSDPSGGAGLQADLKTFHHFGVYGEAVVTLLTVQNTLRVSGVEILPAELVVRQIEAVVEDIPPSAAKTGALGSAQIIEAIAEVAGAFSFPLIVDTVMISKHGAPLLSEAGVEALKSKLLPKSYLVTPNIPEAQALTGMSIQSEEEMMEAARGIRDLGARAVLVKGGHLSGDAVDILYSEAGYRRFSRARAVSRNTHGSGCTFSAAITALLALGHDLEDAVGKAKDYVSSAIETAPGLGRGCGPLNHFASANISEPRDLLCRSTP